MNTKGWDTICLTKVSNANEILRQSWKEAQAGFTVKTSEYTLSGVFDSWSFIEGGGGKFSRMKLPIKQGNFSITETGKTYDLSGSAAIVAVMLNFFGDTISSEFAFDFQRVAHSPSEIDPDKDGYILPINLVDTPQELKIFQPIILTALCEYLVQNPKQIRYALAKINYAQGTQKNWMTPVRCRYAFLDAMVPYIAIMSVCTDRKIRDLPLDVDVSGIDMGNSTSYFVLSSELFFDNVVKQVFMGRFYSSAQDYYFDGQKMTNTAKLYMPAMTVGAIDYSPAMYQYGLDVHIAGSRLFVNMQGECDLYAGITMYWGSNYSAYVSLDAVTQCISFAKRSFNFTHSEDIPWYLRFIPLSFIIDIIVAVISDSLSDGIRITGDISTTGISAIRWQNDRQTIQSAYLYDALIMTY